LFNIPIFGSWLKRVGGVPIDRRNPQGSVEQLKQLILQSDELWILFTPEGTRKKTPGWRSGFYRLAKQAQLPIGIAVLDFKNKEVGIVEFFEPSDNENIDLEILRQAYAGRVGYRPELASPITFWSPFGDS
jgi:1-acyl-sn-glycerol-3-phosphate acyltransferase